MRIQSRQRDSAEKGTAVIVVIAILSILLIFVAGNLRTLHLLRNDLKVIEKQQTNRLASAESSTNSPGRTNGVSSSAPGPPK